MKRGFGLVEIVIGAAIISLSIAALTSTFNRLSVLSRQNRNFTRAAFLLEEGLEAVRAIRDGGWANITSIATSTTTYLLYDNGWKITTTKESISGFEREFKMDPLYRDAAKAIAASGTLEPDVRKIIVTVRWAGPSGAEARSIATYVAKLF